MLPVGPVTGEELGEDTAPSSEAEERVCFGSPAAWCELVYGCFMGCDKTHGDDG